MRKLRGRRSGNGQFQSWQGRNVTFFRIFANRRNFLLVPGKKFAEEGVGSGLRRGGDGVPGGRLVLTGAMNLDVVGSDRAGLLSSGLWGVAVAAEVGEDEGLQLNLGEVGRAEVAEEVGDLLVRKVAVTGGNALLGGEGTLGVGLEEGPVVVGLEHEPVSF